MLEFGFGDGDVHSSSVRIGFFKPAASLSPGTCCSFPVSVRCLDSVEAFWGTSNFITVILVTVALAQIFK